MIITGKSDNLIIAVQAKNKKEVEINGHPIQAKRLDNVTSESSGQNRGRSEQFWKKVSFLFSIQQFFRLESNIASIYWFEPRIVF